MVLWLFMCCSGCDAQQCSSSPENVAPTQSIGHRFHLGAGYGLEALVRHAAATGGQGQRVPPCERSHVRVCRLSNGRAEERVLN